MNLYIKYIETDPQKKLTRPVIAKGQPFLSSNIIKLRYNNYV